MTPTLTDSISRFLTVKKISCSLHTVKTYQKDLSRLTSAFGIATLVSEVTTPQIERLFAKIRVQDTRYKDHPQRPIETGNLSPAYVRRIIKTVKTFFNWCVKEKTIIVSPAKFLQPPPYRGHNSNKDVSATELTIMLHHTRTKPTNTFRDTAILLFLADTSCRIGGLASLTLNHLHLAEGWAKLTEKGHKQFFACFGSETARALQDWLNVRPTDTGHQYVFVSQSSGIPISADSAAMAIRRIAIKSIGRSIGPHAIRHRVARAWDDAGLDIDLISMKLGHSSPTTTKNHYLRRGFNKVLEASQQLSLVALQKRPSPFASNQATFHQLPLYQHRA